MRRGQPGPRGSFFNLFQPKADDVSTESTETLPAVILDATPAPVVKHKGHRFPKGHPCFHRRKTKDRSLQAAMATAIRMNFDPIAFAISIIKTGYILELDGSKTKVETPTRLKLLREIAPYVHSKAPVAIVGKIQHDHTHADLSKIMDDPQMAEWAENLAMAMAEQEAAERRLPPDDRIWPDQD